MITVKMYFIHFIAAVVKENYSFIKIMQPINPNYTWENGVTQIKIAEENLSVTKGKDPSIRVKMHQTFFCFYNSFWYICWVGVIHLTCLVFFVFFKSPWCSSLNNLCSNTLNLKNKIAKIGHKKIFCGISKSLKNFSWPINLCLKSFLTPTKTLRHTLVYT